MARLLVDRRDFLKAAGAGFLASLMPGTAHALLRTGAVYAAAYRARSGGYGMAILGEDGGILQRFDLPDRGHDTVLCPATGRVAVFARRPGTFAVVFDPSSAIAPHIVSASTDRHFYGHGRFSPDGRLLYATENDFVAARGVIGIYDATDGFLRVGELPSHGVGPHDLIMTPDGKMMVVANGGIETHPDYDRTPLNLATMEPNIAFVDRATGALLEKHVLPSALHKLSIRHMDVDDSEAVWFGCQFQGDPLETPPLVGCVRRGEPVRMMAIAPDTTQRLRNYVGSVAVNRRANLIAVSSPKGHVALVVDIGSGRVVRQIEQQDVCGLAPNRTDFVTSDGRGSFAGSTSDVAWDNHITALRRP